MRRAYAEDDVRLMLLHAADLAWSCGDRTTSGEIAEQAMIGFDAIWIADSLRRPLSDQQVRRSAAAQTTVVYGPRRWWRRVVGR